MNTIADEILSYYRPSSEDDELAHIGMPRRSGRYPWGSGEDPYQRDGRDFLSRVEELRKTNFTYTDENGKKWTGDNAIAKSMGLNSTQFRTELAISKDERRLLQVETAKRLRDKEGLGATEIGKRMGLNESSVRSLLNDQSEARMLQARKTADFIKEQVDKKGMVDVGNAVERELGISKEKLNQALYLLEREGYPVYGGRFDQVTNPGQKTTQKVICVPGTKNSAIYELDKVHSLNEDNYTSRDNGETFETFKYPKSMDSKRLMIRYKEDGGIDKDGVIELRRGVEDLSLGESKYSQVRILVDGKKYIKGMAVYGDNMPDGVDVIFNTNKTKDVSKLDVLKDIKADPDNPFGSLIKANGQSTYTDKNGKKQLSLINKTREEGDWDEWADALPSQFLSKQSLPMIKKQLGLDKANRVAEFDDICSLTNPTIKKHLLEKFADGCDSAAIHLKAAALPGQKYHAILPVNSLKDTEVYAPGYDNGTKLALIRYPHGGTFEIPILTVNNKNQQGKKMIGPKSIDAIGITSKVAERLSGADFDGDTVMCIPTHDSKSRVKITSTPPLQGLIGFDPKETYGAASKKVDSKGVTHYYDATGREYRLMTKKGTQTEMGMISNLISDMTLFGADTQDLEKAVRHSMVVIDANKHKLDYKRSEVENDIASLNKKYRKYIDEDGNERVGKGASTIISRAKGEVNVDKRQGNYKINVKGKDNYDPTKPEGSKLWNTADDLYYPVRKYDKTTRTITLRTTDGKKVSYKVDDPVSKTKYEPIEKKDPKTGAITYTNKDGSISYKVAKRQQQSTRMAETDDAMTLVSQVRHPKELAYAEYANSMKSLANQARKELVNTGKIKYDSNAKKTYQKEVSSLMSKLNDAELNRVKERAAQRKANAEIASKKANNENMDASDIKKASQQALTKYRKEVGSIARRDRNIDITDREWEAIQAGAISETQLKKILNNTDTDKLRERATPRSTVNLSTSKINQIKALSSSNFTISEIAKKLNISTSTVSKYLKGAK